MKIGFFTNLDRDVNGTYTKELIKFVLDHGCVPILDTNIHCLYDEEMKKRGVLLYKAFSDSDFVVIIGGDGTILRAAQQACIHNTKIIGINAGTLGFLTDCDISHAKESIMNVIDGNYFVEKRIMLEVGINNEKPILALNEALITKYNYFVNTIKTQLYLENEFINEYISDGIIIATPTGSSAYNLSCHGPLLKYDANMIVINPVSCHDLHSCPLVVSNNDTIKFKIKSKIEDTILVIDGQGCHHVGYSDIVKIKTSELFTTIIKTKKISYYDILRQKMAGERK